MIYKAVYKIVISDDYKRTKHPKSGLVRKWFNEGRSREWMEKEVINLTINRIEQMGNNIFQAVEDTGVQIDGVEYFLTDCENSVRKKEVKTYKANRKPNRWVSLVRKELLRMGFASTHDKWEADDLIKDRCVELGVDNYIICSPDKDLKQIPGIHFSYYQKPVKKNPDGSYPTDQYGHRIVSPYEGLSIVTEKEANRFFWKQMLMGDSGDNIKGVPRVGEKKSEIMLNTCSDLAEVEQMVLDAYVQAYGEEGQDQFNKHKLLIGLGVNHRP